MFGTFPKSFLFMNVINTYTVFSIYLLIQKHCDVSSYVFLLLLLCFVFLLATISKSLIPQQNRLVHYDDVCLSCAYVKNAYFY